MFIQQGDVLFTKVEEVPQDTQSHNSLILVEGEHTGHNHALETAEAEVLTDGFSLFVVVGPEPAQVVHPEHRAVVLDPGVWQVGRVQEYDHFAEEAREVFD